MKRATGCVRALRAAAALALLIGAAACNPVENESQSASRLILDSLTGVDIQGNAANFLNSDVVLVDSESGSMSWRSDIATASFSVIPYDPEPILGTSAYFDVQITRYTVTFIRNDGRNVPGRDVPYGFEGQLTVKVAVNETGTISFVIVREVAKQEMPLLGLYSANVGDVLNMTAVVDFFGRDMAGRAVKATGYLPVYFANYADVTTGEEPAGSPGILRLTGAVQRGKL
jgi:hypothetical protein